MMTYSQDGNSWAALVSKRAGRCGFESLWNQWKKAEEVHLECMHTNKKAPTGQHYGEGRW